MKSKEIEKFFSFDIMPYVTEQIYKEGQTIFAEGMPVSKLLYLADGKAKCCSSSENGIITLIDFMTAPCFLGDLEMFGAQQSTSGVTAITDCKCLIIDLNLCRDRVMNDSLFLRKMCVIFGKKAVHNAANMSMHHTYHLKNRLATFMLDMQSNGVYSTPHTEAAAYLGVTYRHLLYVIAQFTNQGIIKKISDGYLITSKSALEALRITVTF